jgi:hypothetical protein
VISARAVWSAESMGWCKMAEDVERTYGSRRRSNWAHESLRREASRITRVMSCLIISTYVLEKEKQARNEEMTKNR